MSIASQLTALEGNISDAYNMVAQRGGTVPARKNMENLDDAIATIPSGGGGGTGNTREVDANGVYGYPAQNFSFSLPSGATNVGDYALYYAFYRCSSLTSVDLSSLTTVSGYNAFYSAFNSCSNLTSVNLSSLTTVSGDTAFSGAFSYCYGLTLVSFPTLATITGTSVFNYAFRNCSSLTSVSFPALTASSFGSRTNQFNNMLSGCTGVTVHFPAAIQSTIGSWTSVQNGFGGTNTTVLFDL